MKWILNPLTMFEIINDFLTLTSDPESLNFEHTHEDYKVENFAFRK